jgi:hypothetical protein
VVVISTAIRRAAAKRLRTATTPHERALWRALKELPVCFYVCALDLRVRSTYSICQIVMLVQSMKDKIDDQSSSDLQQLITSELVNLVKITSGKIVWTERSDPVELYNLLICGAHFLGLDFVRMGPVTEAIAKLTTSGRISIITLYIVGRRARTDLMPIRWDRSTAKPFPLNRSLSPGREV